MLLYRVSRSVYFLQHVWRDDKITALSSNCHLNRKFAYRNDRNDALEGCTKAHRTQAWCSMYREKFDDVRVIDAEIYPFFFIVNSLFLQIGSAEVLSLNLREVLLLCVSVWHNYDSLRFETTFMWMHLQVLQIIFAVAYFLK